MYFFLQFPLNIVENGHENGIVLEKLFLDLIYHKAFRQETILVQMVS